MAMEPDLRCWQKTMSEDDTAMLLYSFRTIRTSKGMMAILRNLISMVQIILNRFKLEEGSSVLETFIYIIPIFYIYGLVVFATRLLGLKLTMVILSKFEMEEMIREIKEYGAMYLPLVPSILVAILGYDLSFAQKDIF
ncbi:4-coumarate--CoA ligase-like 4 [Elaeis guineensis]|uniref:4-coumarate--CoA ligase-like 4 n=1 Tax=Elaeis guineensis var. tenera TaxID=51953 RepID=UPI003C6D0DC0